MRYNFQIEHIARKECWAPDAFSKAPMKIGFDYLGILQEKFHELLTKEDIERKLKIDFSIKLL